MKGSAMTAKTAAATSFLELFRALPRAFLSGAKERQRQDMLARPAANEAAQQRAAFAQLGQPDTSLKRPASGLATRS